MANVLYDALFGKYAGQDTPFLWLPDGSKVTHRAFLEQAAQFAHVLKAAGLNVGTVWLYRSKNRVRRWPFMRPVSKRDLCSCRSTQPIRLMKCPISLKTAVRGYLFAIQHNQMPLCPLQLAQMRNWKPWM